MTDSFPTRPANWAQPIQAPGLSNFYRVSDVLYRGAEPQDATGYASLAALGVQTVVDLETFSTDNEPDVEAIAGMGYVHNPMEPYWITDQAIVRFLQVVTNPEQCPVFVHCVYGADRTGVCCAPYRVVVQGWTKEMAIAEMIGGGFGVHWEWSSGLHRYIEEMDVAKIKAAING
jgi:protein tyrosine phosphatase (PTP) superfamily phosphohydrolase (DUF442 family)